MYLLHHAVDDRRELCTVIEVGRDATRRECARFSYNTAHNSAHTGGRKRASIIQSVRYTPLVTSLHVCIQPYLYTPRDPYKLRFSIGLVVFLVHGLMVFSIIF